MRKLFSAFLLCISSSMYGQDTSQQVVPGRFNSPEQQDKPYVILISADGFRHDLAVTYKATNLLRLGAGGVQASSMIPSFPSLTFPNHYTIVTGLYPSHHGLVNNNFFREPGFRFYTMSNKKIVADSSWYGGTPLWVLAEQQQMLTASFYWVGSEVNIQGIRPTYYYNYNEKIDIDSRINVVRDWLTLPPEKRPHLICFYLPQVDHDLHMFGTKSREAAQVVGFLDSVIGKLTATVDSLHLPVNYVFVSDHGMTDVDHAKQLSLPKAIDTVDARVRVAAASSFLQLYLKDKKETKKLYKALKKEAEGYRVYTTRNTPARWHFNKKNDPYGSLGDIILVATPPTFFHLWKNRPPNIGHHGFDPAIKDMHASFYAWGPAFKKETRIEPFENIHVFPLITSILGLEYDFPIDGRREVLAPILGE